MADPASLLANPNFAPLVTDPHLRSLLTDPNYAWLLRKYLREQQLEIDAQQEPPPVYVLEPSWPDFLVWERKGLPPPANQEEHVPEHASWKIDLESLTLDANILESHESPTSFYMFNGKYKGVQVSVFIPNFPIDHKSLFKFCDQMARTNMLQHINIVQILGLARDSEETLMIVTEPMSQGILHSFIQKKGSILDVLQVSLQISAAMEHLHNRGIYHGNLCSRNVLVDQNNVTKVFGIGPFGLQLHQGFHTIKTDIFSFGVLLWEMVTRDIHVDLAQSSYTLPKNSKLLQKKNTWELICFEASSLLLSHMDTENPLFPVIEKCLDVEDTTITFSAISTLLKSLFTAQEKEVDVSDDVSVSYDTPKKRRRNRKGKNTQTLLGVFGCNSCKRTFKSEMALQAHTLAKHKPNV